jgi:hypothetical protein
MKDLLSVCALDAGSPGYGDAEEMNSNAWAGVHRHSCLAKEDPDNDASPFLGNGLVARTSTHAR